MPPFAQLNGALASSRGLGLEAQATLPGIAISVALCLCVRNLSLS